MKNSSTPAPNIDDLKKTSPEGDPLIIAIRRRGTAQSGEGEGYPEANKIQAEISNPKRIENERLRTVGAYTNLAGVQQEAGKIDYSTTALGNATLRKSVRAAMQATNWRNRIVNVADLSPTANNTTLSPEEIQLAGFATRSLAGNVDATSDAVSRELGGPRESPFYINVKLDLTKPLPIPGLRAAYPSEFASPAHIQTRSLRASELTTIDEAVNLIDSVTGVAAKTFVGAIAKAIATPGSNIPRNQFVFDGVIGRSQTDPGTPYAWLNGTTLLALAASPMVARLVRPELTAVALVRASDPNPALTCKQICKVMGYPIDFYIRRAAPIVIKATGERVMPVLALRNPPSYKPSMSIQSDAFSGYGRMQNMPIWQAYDESFSLDFTLYCTNRAEALNNVEQLQWLADMIKPTRDDDGNFLTPGGWAYTRIGDMMMHDGETNEMLVFIDAVNISPRDDSPWESLRSQDATDTFQHPMVVDVSISGKRILKNANGAQYAFNKATTPSVTL